MTEKIFLQVFEDEVDTGKLKEFLARTYAEAVEYQKKTVTDPDFTYIDSWDAGYPYEGAIGGGLTYTVGITSIGKTVTVQYSLGPDFIREENITDYGVW